MLSFSSVSITSNYPLKKWLPEISKIKINSQYELVITTKACCSVQQEVRSTMSCPIPVALPEMHGEMCSCAWAPTSLLYHSHHSGILQAIKKLELWKSLGTRQIWALFSLMQTSNASHLASHLPKHAYQRVRGHLRSELGWFLPLSNYSYSSNSQ